jgi:hypothetical protein
VRGRYIIAAFVAIVLALSPLASFAEESGEGGTSGPAVGGEISEKKIPVKEIVVPDYKKEINVDETLDLSASVLPTDATEQTLSYKSENKKIATVNSMGQIKGISAGKTYIVIRAGNKKKRISIRVKVPTEAISVDSAYIVLTPGDTHKIKASVTPKGAPQKLLFKSTNKKAVKVSGNGTVTALKTGSASIMISNEDLTTGVTVIVDRENASLKKRKSAADSPTAGAVRGHGGDDAMSKEDASMITAVQGGKDRMFFSVSDYPLLTPAVLAELYKLSSVAEFAGKGYRMSIDGKEIVNIDNELYSDIAFNHSGSDVEFVLNQGRNLPGKVNIVLTDRSLDRKSLYLYNESKKKYELLDTKQGDTITVDVGGKFLLTNRDIDPFRLEPVVMIIAISGLVGAIITYIVVRRRYWFW